MINVRNVTSVVCFMTKNIVCISFGDHNMTTCSKQVDYIMYG